MDTQSVIDLQTRLDRAEKHIAELHEIICNDDRTWKPVHRVVHAFTRVQVYRQSQREPDKKVLTFDYLTGEYVAKHTGASRPTIDDAFTRLTTAKLLDREVRTVKESDGFTHAISYTHIQVDPPGLPQLTETERAKNNKKYEADKKRAIAEKLARLECPNCQKVGNWKLICGECGCVIKSKKADATDAAQAEIEQPDTILDFDEPEEPETTPERATETPCKTFTSPPDAEILADSCLDKSAPAEEAQSPLAGGLCASVGESDAPPLAEPEARKTFTSAETLTGAETVDALAGMLGDNVFCLVYKSGDIMENGATATGKEAINTRNEWGDRLSWPEHPISASAAKEHLKRGNVGLLGGDRRVWLDVDKGLADLLKLHPMMQMQGRVYRDSATDRAKILILLHEGETLPSKVYEGNGRKVEVLSAGKQGVCAGTHESGDTIKFLPPYDPDDPDVFHAAQIVAMLEQFTATPQRTDQAQTITPPARKVTAGAGRTSRDQVRDAIRWWNEQPRNQAEVKRLLATCKHSGGYVAIRPDDRHPSTRPDRDSYAQTVKQTWRDYGASETLDAFELFCRLSDKDKNSYKWTVVQEYRAAHGLEPLKLR